MGYSKLSGAARAKFDNGVERRTDRKVISNALEEMRIEEGLHHTEAMNDIARNRRELVLQRGVHPETKRPMTVDEFHDAVKTLGELTSKEREQYCETAFSIGYFAQLDKELAQEYPINPLDELVDDGSADDYFRRDAEDRLSMSA